MTFGASLVVHRIKIHLPTQGTRVQSLVQDDPTRHGALGLCASTTEARAPRAGAPPQAEPLRWEACAPYRGAAPRAAEEARPKVGK